MAAEYFQEANGTKSSTRVVFVIGIMWFQFIRLITKSVVISNWLVIWGSRLRFEKFLFLIKHKIL